MKVLIIDFGGKLKDSLKAIGYEDRQVVEVENPLDLVEKFFDAGMAVAIQKSQDDSKWAFIISVDQNQLAFHHTRQVL